MNSVPYSEQAHRDQELFYRSMIERGTREAYQERRPRDLSDLQEEISDHVTAQIRRGERWHLPFISQFLRKEVQTQPPLPIFEAPTGSVIWIRSDKKNPEAMNKVWQIMRGGDGNSVVCTHETCLGYVHLPDRPSLQVSNGILQYVSSRIEDGDERIRFVPEGIYRSPIYEEPPSGEAIVHIVNVPVDSLTPNGVTESNAHLLV